MFNSGAPPSQHTDLADKDSDCSDREMDADDLRDFEEKSSWRPANVNCQCRTHTPDF